MSWKISLFLARPMRRFVCRHRRVHAARVTGVSFRENKTRNSTPYQKSTRNSTRPRFYLVIYSPECFSLDFVFLCFVFMTNADLMNSSVLFVFLFENHPCNRQFNERVNFRGSRLFRLASDFSRRCSSFLCATKQKKTKQVDAR